MTQAIEIEDATVIRGGQQFADAHHIALGAFESGF